MGRRVADHQVEVDHRKRCDQRMLAISGSGNRSQKATIRP
jgi:hypothetical protein